VEKAAMGVAAPPGSPRATVDIWFQGGAMSRVPADASAYPRRKVPFLVDFETGWSDPGEVFRAMPDLRAPLGHR